MVKHVIVSAMRDEAIILTEWLAHHFAVGFDEIYVFTNDCRDKTAEILVELSKHYPVRHFDNAPPYRAPTIQQEALRRAKKNKAVNAADWVLHIDADEFVNVTCGNRRIEDLSEMHAEADAIAVAWRLFGNETVTNWDPGMPSLPQFTMCEAVPEMERVAFKTMFRLRAFRKFSIHTPKLPVDPEAFKVVNTVGRNMPNAKMLTRRGSGYPIEDIRLASWENATINHYHVRPDILQRAKHARGDANGRSPSKRKIGSAFYELANRNETRDESILYYGPETARIQAEMRKIPAVSKYEEDSRAWLLRNYA